MPNVPLRNFVFDPAFDFDTSAKNEIIKWLEKEIAEAVESGQMYLDYWKRFEKEEYKQNADIYHFQYLDKKARAEQLQLLLECYK